MRNIIVTGATRGVGLAIAATLARGGDRVIAIARNESAELRAASAALGAEPRGSLNFRSFDLSDTGGIARFVAGLKKEFGSFHGLVNNAAVGTPGVLALMRDADIEGLMRLNVVSTMVFTKYVLRVMMNERAGRIINISSIASATGYSGLSAYAASKAALIGFTRSLAREVGPLGITVNAVAPGFLDTEMTRELTGAQRGQIERRSALRRLADVADVAGAVEFLLSDRAKNVTGITLTVDAGNTA